MHVVALSPASGNRLSVVGAEVITDPGDVVLWVASLGQVGRVAIDAPSGLSPRWHADDLTLAPKFRSARCGEIALGREVGIWVPWVSPAIGATDIAPWISVGLALFAAFGEAGIDAVETFPHAVFRVLNGGARVAAKSKPGGLAERAILLRAAGVDEPTLPLWGHDGLDAAAAALVAADPGARAVTCGHDGSAIWIPPDRV